MNGKKIKLCIALLMYAGLGYGQIKLPKLISNGMVLQRDMATKVWGWASSKEAISLKFNNKLYHTIADEKGNWMIKLPGQTAGGPYEMVLKGKNEIVINDVLFGDVWICSGQSNMELPMQRLIDQYPKVIAEANNSKIRQFLVPDEYDFNQQREDFSSGSWVKADQKNILNFSGVAYFFALDIYEKKRIPIGLINTALGGSPAESWISEEAIKIFPAYYAEAQKFKDKTLISSIEGKDAAAGNEWQKLLNSTDIGIKNNWKNENTDVSTWMTMNIPGYWADADLGKVNGSVWFRKEVILSKEMVGKPAKLLLGRIVDADSVFINGQFVGTTSYQYPPRRYLLQNTVLKEGKNVIVIKVVNNSGRGGFVIDKPYELIVDGQKIDLKGAWKYSLGAKMDIAPSQTFVRWKPVGLYNAMIAPLTNYAIKGALWYQGEANTFKAEEYKSLMTTLVSDWRKHWNQGDFPFLYVQLPGFMENKSTPTESNWAKLRQQQLALSDVTNTGMAVAIDLGEWNDIHPLNKQDVGKRLALQAQKVVYGDKNVIASGPLFKSVKQIKDQLEITFSNLGGGLKIKGAGTLKYFAIAGADRKFVWAKARIVNDKVLVGNSEVSNPMYVRYAWADNPVGANLYNKAGLPASPFEGTIF
jgi:sialate O-acetylesterase